MGRPIGAPAAPCMRLGMVRWRHMTEDRFLTARSSRALELTAELGELLDSLTDEGLEEVKRAKQQLARLTSTFKQIERLGRSWQDQRAWYDGAIADDASPPEPSI